MRSFTLHSKNPDRGEEGNNLCVLPPTITKDSGFPCLSEFEMDQMPHLTFRERDIIKPPHKEEKDKRRPKKSFSKQMRKVLR